MIRRETQKQIPMIRKRLENFGDLRIIDFNDGFTKYENRKFFIFSLLLFKSHYLRKSDE